MNEAKTKQRLFDISEYKEKVQQALEKLEENQQPGELSGKGTKMVVLEATKERILELLKKGYTTKQISDAISDDVFGILPKTITQLTGTRPAARKPKARHTPPAPPANDNRQPAPATRQPVTEITDVE